MNPQGFDAIIQFMNTQICKINGTEPEPELLARAAEILRRGGLVAFPTETVYGLGGNALDPEAAARIYAAKGRPSDNPLILHIADRTALTELAAEVPEAAEKLMEAFWPGPMTLIFHKSEKVPRETTGGLDTAAVRMPSHPVARALIRTAGIPIAAPSANSSGRPSPTLASHVAEDLDGRIDMILDGGAVEIGLESTIVDVTGETPVILRPGFISLEAVRRVLGQGEMDPAILGDAPADLRPKAPGMKYRHYAPKAEMILVEGEPSAVVRTITALAEESRRQGKRAAVLCSEESRNLYGTLPCRAIGVRAQEETVAHNLYRCLREFDEEGTDVIYSETFSQGELGPAIMNRMRKAAGGRIIQAGGGDVELG